MDSMCTDSHPSVGPRHADTPCPCHHDNRDRVPSCVWYVACAAHWSHCGAPLASCLNTNHPVGLQGHGHTQ